MQYVAFCVWFLLLSLMLSSFVQVGTCYQYFMVCGCSSCILWLNNILLFGYTTSCLFTYHGWTCWLFQLLWIVPLWIFLCKSPVLDRKEPRESWWLSQRPGVPGHLSRWQVELADLAWKPSFVGRSFGSSLEANLVGAHPDGHASEAGHLCEDSDLSPRKSGLGA